MSLTGALTMESNPLSMVGAGVVWAWLLWGFNHFGPFYLDAIHKEAFRLGHEGLAQQGRLLVWVPESPVSWFRIFFTCLLFGPFARKAMKKFFGIEHNYFDED